jgi:ribosomal protein S16
MGKKKQPTYRVVAADSRSPTRQFRARRERR